MKGNWAISVLVSIVVLGLIGFSQEVEATNHEVILGGTAVDDDAEMYFIDPNTGIPIEFLGDLLLNGRSTDISAIDVDPAGRIFAAGTGALEGPLVQVVLVPGGALAIPIPGFDESTCNGMSFAPDGTFYCFDGRGGGLHIIDLAAGTKTLLGPTGLGSTGGNGLAINQDGIIFHGTSDTLNTLDLVTGAALTSIPWILPPQLEDQFCKPNAMDFSSDGVLFAHMDCRDNTLVTIDPATAQVTFVGETVRWLDAITFVPGPTPPESGSIHGMKWNDENSNGILDPGEQGVPDIEICLFLNDGFDGGTFLDVAFEDTFGIQIAEANIGPIGGFELIECVFTDDNGNYWFENLLPGFYIVEEFLIDQIQVFPDRDFVDEFGQCPFFFESSCLDLLDFFHPDNRNPSIPHFIEVASGERVEGVNFGNIPAGSLHGMKWDDANGDGVRDVGESGLPGIEVLLFKLTPPDTQGEFVLSTFTMFDDPITPEDETGMYWLTVEPGFYRIEEVSPFNRAQTFPANGAPHFVQVDAEQSIEGLDFGNALLPVGSIEGLKFRDTNGNGVHERGETEVGGIQICLSPVGICTVTSGDGTYNFDNLPAGDYIVTETVPFDVVNTTPTDYVVTVTPPAVTQAPAFGNVGPTPPPPEVTVEPTSPFNSRGLPTIYWQNSITFTKDTGPTGFDHCSIGSGPGLDPTSVDLQLDFTQPIQTEIISMDLVGGTSNVWTVTTDPFFPKHGVLNITFLVECGDTNPLGPDEIQNGGSIYIDPSGVITDICTDEPLAGATVSLFKESPPGTGNFVLADPSDYIQDDPPGSVQTTGADGKYGWDTVAGTYKVLVEATGFVSTESSPVDIPPPVTDLDIALEKVGGCPTGPGSDDHYLGYDVKETKHTDKFEKFTVTLSDQFESATYTVDKPDRLYNPVQKTHDGTITEITDEISHYVGYKIKTPKGDPKFEKVTNVLVENQFGQIIVDVKKPKLLLVPSLKDHDQVPVITDPFTINHFKCYDVKETKDTPKFEKRIVSLYDPNFEITQDFEVKKPKMLCTPVQKTLDDGSTTPIMDEENHLMCYDVKKMKGEPKFEKRNVFTNNQFGPEDLEVKKQKQLCVPSIKTLL